MRLSNSKVTRQTGAMWAGAGLIATLVAVVFAGGLVPLTDGLRVMTDTDALTAVIRQLGPFAVVALLAVAVIVSPIPSGPVAMAAGALYGTVEGGLLTAAGAILGAMGAFSLSRVLGFRPLSACSIPLANWITRPRSQGMLAGAVLVSRLIPFISFDAVSYVAGLTPLRTTYFLAATAAGVLPASFAFAALGAGMAELNSMALLTVALGVTLVGPAIWLIVRKVSAVSRPPHRAA